MIEHRGRWVVRAGLGAAFGLAAALVYGQPTQLRKPSAGLMPNPVAGKKLYAASRAPFMRSLLLVLAVILAPGTVTAAELPPRSSNAAGVKVVVTPKRIAASTATWEFAVVLDTHSQDLSDDLLKTAVLVDAQGGRHAPLAWQGAPPGGHHREGVLRFKGLGALPEAIEVQIRRSGEAAPRSFRWKLK